MDIYLEGKGKFIDTNESDEGEDVASDPEEDIQTGMGDVADSLEQGTLFPFLFLFRITTTPYNYWSLRSTLLIKYHLSFVLITIVAWEMLELARVIYSKDSTKKLELSDVYQSIGDLSMESGTFHDSGSNTIPLMNGTNGYRVIYIEYPSSNFPFS